MRTLTSRLVLWNTAILIVALVALGGTISWLNLRRMAEGIDRELLGRANGFGRGGPGGPGGGMGGGFGPGPRAGPGSGGRQGEPQTPRSGQTPPGEPAAQPGQRQPGQAPPDHPQAGQVPLGEAPGQPRRALPPPFNDPAAERMARLRRPRLVDPEGNVVGGIPTPDRLFDPEAVAQARRGLGSFSYGTFEEEPVRVRTEPAPRFGQGFVVQVASDLREYRSLAGMQWLTLLTVLPFAILAAVLGGRFLTGKAMRPIGAMAGAARAIGEGDFDRRVDAMGDDEFGLLARDLNRMATSLGASFEAQQEAYRRLERAFEEQRLFVADASHELKTPLTRLQLATSDALADPNADQRHALEVADESGRAMAVLVRQLLLLAQSDAGELKPQFENIDLRVLAADLVDRTPASEAWLKLDVPENEVVAKVDPEQFARALSNLIENALRHTPSGGTVMVRVRQDGIDVEDEGSGIAPEHLPHVTRRFYRIDSARTREAGGSGLGLAIVEAIMHAHGGRLAIQSELGKGTKASLLLPANFEFQTNPSRQETNLEVHDPKPEAV